MFVVSQAWLCAAYAAVLGCVCGWTVLGQQWAHACCGVELRSEGGKRADSCLRLCCGAAGNKIGEAGALAVSKALESGNCKLTSLDIGGESGAWLCAAYAAVLGCVCGWTVFVQRGVDFCWCLGCCCIRILGMIRLGTKRINDDLRARLKNLCESMVARQLLAFGQGFSARLGADSAIGGCPLDCMQSISHYVYRV